ncbi:MAG TPA: GNAT family N-acetyltransferase [Angustibacter sp.]|nr:GNAT family N-acetyltransferase [Angustibacter sp.]
MGSTQLGSVARVDLADDALLRRLFEVEAASKRAGRPWHDPESPAAFAADQRFVDPGEDHLLWAAWNGGRAVGLAHGWFPITDNVDKAYCMVEVEPAARGHGLGTALLDAVLDEVERRGRHELLSELLLPLDAGPEHPYRRFADRHGFAEASRDSMRHLALPVGTARLDELEAQARAAWSGRYRLETYVGGVPEHLQESLCDTENQLAVDAPAGTVEYEPESITPERYRERMRLFNGMGRERFTTVAVDGDGQVVAYTDLVVGSGTRTSVWQWGTLVRREHRGHRLGLAVKVENLRRLQSAHPERTVVMTGNADVNQHMLAINEALGFRLVEACPQLQRRL